MKSHHAEVSKSNDDAHLEVCAADPRSVGERSKRMSPARRLSPLPWFKDHTADWRRRTRGMSFELKGFYQECRVALWEQPSRHLPTNESKLAILLGCNPRTIRKLLPHALAEGLLVASEIGYFDPLLINGSITNGSPSDRLPDGAEITSGDGAELDRNSLPIAREFAPKLPESPLVSTRALESVRALSQP